MNSRRLTPFRERLPAASQNSPSPHSLGAFKMWDARRRNRYLAAHARLPKLIEERDLPELVLAFAEITRFLAPLIPADVGLLPRGYTWGKDCEGEESFLKDGVLLNPGFADPLPPMEMALEFARDLTGGWLAELDRYLGEGQ